jgi:hypothetical protein
VDAASTAEFRIKALCADVVKGSEFGIQHHLLPAYQVDAFLDNLDCHWLWHDCPAVAFVWHSGKRNPSNDVEPEGRDAPGQSQTNHHRLRGFHGFR